VKKYCFFILALITVFSCSAQQPGLIDVNETTRIINILASDEMGGRRAFTPQLDKAADFIAAEFKAAGLQTFDNGDSYRQEFAMVSSKLKTISCIINNEVVAPDKIVTITSQQSLFITEKSGFEKVFIRKGQRFSEIGKYIGADKNYLVVVDTSFAANFKRLNRYQEGLSDFMKSDKSTVFVLTNLDPVAYTVDAKFTITEKKLANVVGMLPGKSKKNEYVIFSAHYDHIGTGSPREGVPHDNIDSIYNGANDDASGTTAVIMLAKYFNALKNNERTIIFAAFTAEELGGYGSQYFSKQLAPEAVVAMFNIEMIGTESKWGRNSAYITGYEKTNMGKILQKDLRGTGFTFFPDPYPEQNLFYRSDNATLAQLGVPAHTISTSKMDNEPNYHKASDEVKTLDLDNMAKIIQSIALSSSSIISGKETPTRVKPDN
jgi:hypothetical protein